MVDARDMGSSPFGFLLFPKIIGSYFAIRRGSTLVIASFFKSTLDSFLIEELEDVTGLLSGRFLFAISMTSSKLSRTIEDFFGHALNGDLAPDDDFPAKLFFFASPGPLIRTLSELEIGDSSESLAAVEALPSRTFHF